MKADTQPKLWVQALAHIMDIFGTWFPRGSDFYKSALRKLCEFLQTVRGNSVVCPSADICISGYAYLYVCIKI